MTATSKDPVLVVLQLSGGNDYMNTIVPFADPHYYDNRPLLQLAEDDLLRLDDEVAFNPSMGPLHEMYTKGEVAVLHGVGWAGSNRSHFRCMDIWHTAEPDEFASQGWLGKATRQIDPNGENPVTTVNVGQDCRERWWRTACPPLRWRISTRTGCSPRSKGRSNARRCSTASPRCTRPR